MGEVPEWKPSSELPLPVLQEPWPLLTPPGGEPEAERAKPDTPVGLVVEPAELEAPESQDVLRREDGEDLLLSPQPAAVAVVAVLMTKGTSGLAEVQEGLWLILE